MRDIPMFTTQYGVASLSLREIPYRGEAYVRLRTVREGCLRELLEECRQFCRMAGAEKVFAAWDQGLEEYPLHAAILRMSGTVCGHMDPGDHLFPVTEQTVDLWRRTLNRRMEGVDCAATLTKGDEAAILAASGACFVHSGGALLGMGWLENGNLKTLAAVKPGAGERVARAVLSLAGEEPVALEVASTNIRAIRLYERLGLVKTGEICRWHFIGGA